jgi:hypothetical protein
MPDSLAIEQWKMPCGNGKGEMFEDQMALALTGVYALCAAVIILTGLKVL